MKPKFLAMQFKTTEVKEDGPKGIIEGYASTFGNVDLGFDVVDKGAFDKTIRENRGRFPILADHDPTKQIGWNEHAEEDDKGLLVRGELAIGDVQLAKERFALTRKAHELGANSGLSIGYRVIKDEGDPDNPIVRHLKEIKLYEYSLVTFPMNTEAMVTTVKNWWDRSKDHDLESACKSFVELLLESGYRKEDLHRALSRAAQDGSEPKENLHSICSQLDRISKVFEV